ncbi:mismatch-specific DNA-glycosylase, partial [Candidatus Roizmanbacteria bacterium]|nr:mismatch-specific DNA-glycosylase [Candidatus Roizmanbacteria bacterium]
MQHPKPTKQELTEAIYKTVPDLIKPNLKMLFVGINPGLYTAAIGHHFGRPGNRFWPALFAAGFTPHLFSPYDSARLLDLGFGITNMVKRTTLRADELTREELVTGGKDLVETIKNYTPQMVAILGIDSYRKAF